MTDEMAIEHELVRNLTIPKLNLFDISYGLKGIATALEQLLENQIGAVSNFRDGDRESLSAAYELALGAKVLATLNQQIIGQQISDSYSIQPSEQAGTEARNEH